mmetsp:Transcript_104177/g.293786  ORF Transcript_104177/g.293786 Transcript_104177/m.293786 type:complete len:316 (+) Transcript_104177:18-965(+)
MRLQTPSPRNGRVEPARHLRAGSKNFRAANESQRVMSGPTLLRYSTCLEEVHNEVPSGIGGVHDELACLRAPLADGLARIAGKISNGLAGVPCDVTRNLRRTIHAVLGYHHARHSPSANDRGATNSRCHLRPGAPTGSSLGRRGRSARLASWRAAASACSRLDVLQVGNGDEHLLSGLRARRHIHGEIDALVVRVRNPHDTHLAALRHPDGHGPARREGSCRLSPPMGGTDVARLSRIHILLVPLLEVVLVMLAPQAVLRIRETGLKRSLEDPVLLLGIVFPLAAELHLEHRLPPDATACAVKAWLQCRCWLEPK